MDSNTDKPKRLTYLGRLLRRLVRQRGLSRAFELADSIDDRRREKWHEYLRDCRAGRGVGTIYDVTSARLRNRSTKAHHLVCDLYALTNAKLSDSVSGKETKE